MKYFVDTVDYGMNQIVDSASMLEESVLYNYVPSSFVNGWINHVSIIKGFVIDRYNYEDDISHKVNLHMALDCNWFNFEFSTKKEAVDFIASHPEYKFYHTDLHMFKDDVFILAKTENYYWYFWFDCDVSDCSIGRFKTEDAEEDVIKEFEKVCREISETGDVIEFKKEWIRGWIEF